MGRIAYLAMVVALVGCGTRSNMGGREAGISPDTAAMPDGQPDVATDRATDDGPASFCTGSMARMVLNGTEANPTVHGENLPLSCCFANQLEIISATVGFPLMVVWHTTADDISTTPLTLDLANLPQGWTVRVVAGCDPVMSTCPAPGDIYDSGLAGSLQVARLAAIGYDTTICLHLVEPAGSSHPLIHTMDFYAPHVVATY